MSDFHRSSAEDHKEALPFLLPNLPERLREQSCNGFFNAPWVQYQVPSIQSGNTGGSSDTGLKSVDVGRNPGQKGRVADAS